MKSRVRYTLLTLVGLGGVALWIASSAKHQPAALPRASKSQQPGRIVPQTPSAALAGYVGNQVCGECHAEIADRYQRSGMARSWRSVEGETGDEIRRLLDESTVVEDSTGEYRYRVAIERGQIVQQESWTRKASGDKFSLERAARYAVGSGKHAVALICELNGYLHQLPAAWYAADNEWRMNPGFELYNHRFDRPVTPGCVACHGTVAEHHPATRNRFKQPIVDGIGCERCHGPGQQHANFHRGQITADGGMNSEGDPIVNPADLPLELGNDVCLQCHLQGDVVLYRNGADAFSFRPGNRLRDQREDFLIATDQPEAFGVASHGSRLMRSRCYQASGHALTCFRCHDPHAPVEETSQAAFDSRCIECHQPRSCARVAPPAEKSVASGCVHCHMPRRPTREGQHIVFTDHWIRRTPEAVSEPQLLEPNADVELVSPWPGVMPESEALGSAYILLHETRGPQLPALERGVRLLVEAGPIEAADIDALYWRGSGLLSLRRSAEARRVLTKLLARQPEHLQARFRLAISLDQLQQYAAAIQEYETIVASQPDWLEPYPLLSRLYLFRNQPASAERLLLQQVEFLPDGTALANLALAQSLQGKNVQVALQLTEDALQLDPRNVRVRLVRAHLLTLMERRDEAKQEYSRVLAVDPGNATAQQGLQGLERSQGASSTGN